MSVLQEIDLVIAKAGVDRATKDAEAAGNRIGTAIGNAPGVKRAAFQLGEAIASEITPNKAVAKATRFIEGLERTFQLAQADIREAQARGFVTPIIAREKGIEAARAFNTGVLTQIRGLGETGALSGRAGQDVFVGLSNKLKNVGVEAERSAKGLGTVKSAMFSLAAQAAGTGGSVGALANGLLTLGGGSAVAIGVVAGLGLIAKGFSWVTSGAETARTAVENFINSAQAARLAAAGPIAQIDAQIADGRAKLAKLQEETRGLVGKAQTFGSALGVGSGLLEVGFFNKELKADLAKIAQLKVALAGLEREKQRLNAERGFAQLGSVGQNNAGDTVTAQRRVVIAKERLNTESEIDRLLAEEAKTQLKLAEDETNAQEKLAANRTTLMADLQRQIAAATPTAVDDLELELHALQVKIIETFGSVPAAVQPLLDDYRKKIAAAKEETDKAKNPVKDLATNWENVGNTIATVAQGILDLANGLGIVDERMSKVAQGAISLGRNLPKALAGDPTAILGAAGGAASVLGGLFGGGDSPELKALREALKSNEEAIRDNTKVLEIGVDSTRGIAAKAGLRSVLRGEQGRGWDIGIGEANPDKFQDREKLDAALRRAGTSLKELEAIASQLGISISDLSVHEFQQLEDRLGQVDLAAIKLAEDMAKAADDMAKAGDNLHKAEDAAAQRSDILDQNTLDAARARAAADANIPALQGVTGQDLSTEAGRAAADKSIQDLFGRADSLTTEQRGGLSVEDFRALLLDWEHLLDTLRADEAQKQRDHEQEMVDQRTLLEKQQAFEALKAKGLALGGEAQRAVEVAGQAIADALAAAQGPLGPNGPLAQDAQRRADQAVADAERAVAAGEQAQGKGVEAGSSVVRTITEASAGRLVGELVTANVLAEKRLDLLGKIYRQLGGMDTLSPARDVPVSPGADAGRIVGELVTSNVWLQKIHDKIGGSAAASGSPAPAPIAQRIEIPVLLDGVEITRVVSEQMSRMVQNRAILNGRADMP